MAAETTTPDMHWTPELLLSKARLYIERASSHQEEDELFWFWGSLSLEFLARAALAFVHPALLADVEKSQSDDGRNIVYAIGVQPNVDKFTPKSIPVSQVHARCLGLVPGFADRQRRVCEMLASLRNEELHSGGTPFATIRTSEWLPRFYEAAKTFLVFMEKGLADWLGDAPAVKAEEMLRAAQDEAAKAVQKMIQARRTVWDDYEPKDKDRRRAGAVKEATPDKGHRANCPSCGSVGLVNGDVIRTQPAVMEEGQITIRSSMLPTHFVCTACGLDIKGTAQLMVAGLGDVYTRRLEYSPLEYYSDDLQEYIRENHSDDGDEYDNE